MRKFSQRIRNLLRPDRRQRRRSSFRLPSSAALESLEDRVLLAGNATVSLLDGVHIVGDAEANLLTVELVDGNVVVTGRDGTTINGSDQSFTVSSRSIESGINVWLGDGNDSLRLLGVEVTGATVITTGLGDDNVTLDGTTFGQSVVIGTGGGDDEVSVLMSTISGDLSVYTTTGDDNIRVAESKIGGTLKAFAGDGDDVVMGGDDHDRLAGGGPANAVPAQKGDNLAFLDVHVHTLKDVRFAVIGVKVSYFQHISAPLPARRRDRLPALWDRRAPLPARLLR